MLLKINDKQNYFFLFELRRQMFNKVSFTMLSVFLVFNLSAQIYQPFPNENLSEQVIEKLLEIDHGIDSYRIKINYVKSDSVQLVQAESDDWFEMMHNSMVSKFDKKREIFREELNKNFIAKEEFERLSEAEQAELLNDNSILIELN